MNARTRVVLYVVVVGIALATILLMIGQLTDRVQRAESAALQSQAAAEDNAVALEDARTLIGRLGTQVKGLGGTPVVVPADIPEPTEAVGPTGATGATGATGDRGPRGFIGPIGPRGIPGDDGRNGDDGATVTGPAGSDGAAGAQGERGPEGPAGPAGQQGPAGERGEPGGDGRGVTGLACDSATPLTLTVTYSDGTRETYTCGGQQ